MSLELVVPGERTALARMFPAFGSAPRTGDVILSAEERRAIEGAIQTPAFDANTPVTYGYQLPHVQAAIRDWNAMLPQIDPGTAPTAFVKRPGELPRVVSADVVKALFTRPETASLIPDQDALFAKLGFSYQFKHAPSFGPTLSTLHDPEVVAADHNMLNAICGFVTRAAGLSPDKTKETVRVIPTGLVSGISGAHGLLNLFLRRTSVYFGGKLYYLDPDNLNEIVFFPKGGASFTFPGQLSPQGAYMAQLRLGLNAAEMQEFQSGRPDRGPVTFEPPRVIDNLLLGCTAHAIRAQMMLGMMKSLEYRKWPNNLSSQARAEISQAMSAYVQVAPQVGPTVPELILSVDALAKFAQQIYTGAGRWPNETVPMLKYVDPRVPESPYEHNGLLDRTLRWGMSLLGEGMGGRLGVAGATEHGLASGLQANVELGMRTTYAPTAVIRQVDRQFESGQRQAAREKAAVMVGADGPISDNSRRAKKTVLQLLLSADNQKNAIEALGKTVIETQAASNPYHRALHQESRRLLTLIEEVKGGVEAWRLIQIQTYVTDLGRGHYDQADILWTTMHQSV
ncbi:hypothetical protein A2160_01685 [Candidatus Beckwithbacteria bacterium RBG_13_42_9]|uniref:Uncharacterized protein n=1 Tax=Candidatus Beckwithbacteria bacterium RBG_13_42_9 TaxID=1797457 RepID=A0A1F5E9B8_9BACT|nr:MAG: hypothetical protein A2160_01685 [Candidatus Beckwithbacteria bacterium RBG_13_42_9]